MNSSKQVAIIASIILIAFLAEACGILPSEGVNDETATSMPTFTPIPPTLTPTSTPDVVSVTDIPTLLPTPQPPPILPPDAIQVERWKEYQTELAEAFLAFDPDHPEGYDPKSSKDAFCEWDIFGQSGQEVYVWADCNSANGLALHSNPAVIYLEPGGSIREVNVAKAKPDPRTQFAVYDLHLFPMSVQETLCLFYFFGIVPQCDSLVSDYHPGDGLSAREHVLISHLEYRLTHPEEPPLVVLSTMAATPTP